MRHETITYYSFDELSDDAKQNAIEHARDWNVQGFDWWDFVYEDTKSICAILGFDVTDMNFSGFWSQGDGASLFGSYSYASGALHQIREYAPKDSVLHDVAKQLQDIQKRNFYQLRASVTRNHYSGNYSHSGVMSVCVERDSDNCQSMTDDAESVITDALRDIADWLYSRLEDEYRYLTSDECVAESLRTNECEFTKKGKLI